MRRPELRRSLGLAILCSLLALPVAPSWAAPLPQEKEDEKEKEEDAKKDEASEKDRKAAEAAKAKKPRVITNADLEKYGKGASRPGTRATVRPDPRTGRLGTGPGASGELPGDEGIDDAEADLPTAPPEERLESATLPELEDRRGELETLLAYLEAKIRWLRNPLLPAPTPPAGEVLLDPKLSGAQEMELARTRAFQVRGRLQKVNVLIGAGGGNL